MKPFIEEILRNNLKKLEDEHLLITLKILSSSQGPWVEMGGRRVLNLSSNNYLGFNSHPSLIKASIEATEKWGVGSGAVRTIVGTQEIHMELEHELASFKKVGACLVFQSGYATNLGVIQALMTEGDVIISDELNHASIIDGARLSKAKIHVYRHVDMNHLEEKLKEARDLKPGKILLVTDGVFSMDGDIAPLPQITELAERYEAILMVDDAHASGVLGRNGRGTVDHFNLHGRVDIQVGTLSKALGTMGGYVASSQTFVTFLIQKGRPILFSTSHPPGVVAATLVSLKIINSLEGEELIKKLWENTGYFKDNLKNAGFNIGVSQTPITPIMVGDAEVAQKYSSLLLEDGVLALGIGYPTVALGKARIRTIVTSSHTKKDLDLALKTLCKIGRKIGII